MERLTSADDLHDAVGAPFPGGQLKSIDEFDQHCVDILALARAVVIGAEAPDGLTRSTLTGGAAGFASVAGPQHLRLPIPDGYEAAPGTPAGLVFLVPGLGETLRVNGTVRADGSGIDAEEIYVHCAKSVIRSKLWDGPPERADPSPGTDSAGPTAPALTGAGGEGPISDEVADLLARSPFAVLTSSADGGAADASPKGDPAGFVRVLDRHTVAVPDRPGNRRTDTFHNLVEHDAVGVVALVPGSDEFVELRGRARLTTDADLRESMAVKGRVPKLVVVIDVAHAERRTSPGLVDADLWDPAQSIDSTSLPKVSQVWTDHVRLNKDPGEANEKMRSMMNPDDLDAGLAFDYETNLY